MNVRISELAKLKSGQGKAAIEVDNFLELAMLEDQQSKGKHYEIVEVASDEIATEDTIEAKAQRMSAMLSEAIQAWTGIQAMMQDIRTGKYEPMCKEGFKEEIKPVNKLEFKEEK